MSIWALINMSLLFPIVGVALVVLIVLLIVKRRKEYREETFEKRDH
jgi:LPXTG-motif cell wall-anchored protein